MMKYLLLRTFRIFIKIFRIFIIYL